jgi:glycosyltransferase involved in cell wall biosynthesis
MDPAISVVFPVWERKEYLAEAIESVLGQTFENFELIVVLDGVSSGVQAIVENYRDARIRVISLPLNLGISNARNTALRVARAPYVALMDSDDVALPHRFATQHAWMEAHPDLTACGSNSVKLLKHGERMSMVYPETDAMVKARLLLVDSALLNPTAMLRMDFIRHHALQYDANLPRDNDHRFYVEMARLGARFHGLQQELLLYRRHDSNATNDPVGVDGEKTRVREILIPIYFPELTGFEQQILLRGMTRRVTLTLEEACMLVATLNKAAAEARVFLGEDRAELRRILGTLRQRILTSIGGATAEGPAAARAG